MITGCITRIQQKIFGTLQRFHRKLVMGQYADRWAGFRLCKVRHTGLTTMGGHYYFQMWLPVSGDSWNCLADRYYTIDEWVLELCFLSSNPFISQCLPLSKPNWEPKGEGAELMHSPECLAFWAHILPKKRGE